MNSSRSASCFSPRFIISTALKKKRVCSENINTYTRGRAKDVVERVSLAKAFFV